MRAQGDDGDILPAVLAQPSTPARLPEGDLLAASRRPMARTLERGGIAQGDDVALTGN